METLLKFLAAGHLGYLRPLTVARAAGHIATAFFFSLRDNENILYWVVDTAKTREE